MVLGSSPVAVTGPYIYLDKTKINFGLICSRPAAEILFHGGLVVHVVVTFVTRI